MSGARALLVSSTVDGEDRARELASALVEEGLAACVQVLGPIRSVYRWRGEVETATEWLLLAKTTEGRFPALRDAIVRRHPYEVPEIVAVPITDGLPAYLAWLADATA